MAEEVLGRRPVTRLGDGIQNEHQKELQTVGHQNLALIFEDYMVVWHAPGCGVVFQSLPWSAFAS
jgi:hypothetical protein